MQQLPAILITALLLFSCRQQKQQSQQPAFADTMALDSVAIVNDPRNNLTIQTNTFSEIDSSGIVMFPLSMSETRGDGGSLSYKEIPYSSYWNIIFYNSHTAQYHLLSERKMLISSFDVKFSNEDQVGIASSTKYIFYKVTVDDYNQDKKLTGSDPEYLFVSDKEGNNFRQISPAGYHLKSWQFLHSSNKIIMTLLKDSDNNQKFTDKDEVTSFQIDIDKNTPATELFSTAFKNQLKMLYSRDWKREKEN